MKRTSKILFKTSKFLCRLLQLVVQLLVFSVAVVALLSVPCDDLTIAEWLCTLVLSKIVGVMCAICWFASLREKKICDEE